MLNLSKVDWSLLVSFFAFALALFTYILHDRRLKKQERLINDYQLKKIYQEEDEISKALVKANVVRHDRGKRVIKIFNAGKAVARNINFEILSEIEGISTHGFDELFPYEFLNPQESTEFIIFLYAGPTQVIRIKTRWDDDFTSNNEYNQVLTL